MKSEADGVGRGFELPVNLCGFSVYDSAVAPKAVGYFQDEVFLEDAFWFEFVDQGVDELFVLGTILGEMGGFEDNVAGMETVGDGVASGDSPALGGAGPGGFFGVAPVSGDLFGAGSHVRILYQKDAQVQFGGKLLCYCGGPTSGYFVLRSPPMSP